MPAFNIICISRAANGTEVHETLYAVGVNTVAGCVEDRIVESEFLEIRIEPGVPADHGVALGGIPSGEVAPNPHNKTFSRWLASRIAKARRGMNG